MNDLIASRLPKRVGKLHELAYNLWWSWNIEARQLFKSLDNQLWKTTGHNPVKLLQQLPSHRLAAAADDPMFLKKYDSVMSNFEHLMSGAGAWADKQPHGLAQHLIAYLSLEFAIHNSLPLYAGGLGVLAGDYCKEASDLGLPVVGVGFMYPQGYFRQHVSADGWQQEVYEQLNFAEAPISQVLTRKGKPMTIEVPLDQRSVRVGLWQVNIGRVKLYLLDTNVEGNAPHDRELSARLYAGDQEIRLQQAIIIGIGGVRALRALGIHPTIWHANEGYTAFMTLELVRELVDQGLDFNEAARRVQASSVFTIHSLVPGGNDSFSRDLIADRLHRYCEWLKVDKETFLGLGALESDKSVFNTTMLGLRMSRGRNGVSILHGGLCRESCHFIWPEVEEQEVPVTSVTNGVHVSTWVAPQTANLYETYIARDWLKRHDDPALWNKVSEIPDERIWQMRRWLKAKLIGSMKERARRRWAADRIAPEQVLAMGALFDTDVLTIAFSRRFTEYKRPALILNDLGRLKQILRNEFRPVQIVFAGKAHPNDDRGKQLIHEVYERARDTEFGGRIAFVEDYDMHMARFLVHGADVWLNNPEPLHEASGTSGQKASINGVLNLSVLDGWWSEGYDGRNGWAIQGNPAADSAEQDRTDAAEIYRLLEEEIIPLFYDRDINGVPHGWIQIIKDAIQSNVPRFSARRMLKEYATEMYLPAAGAGESVPTGVR